MRRNNFTGTLSRSILIKKLDDVDVATVDGTDNVTLDKLQSANSLKDGKIDPVWESLLYQNKNVSEMPNRSTSLGNKSRKCQIHICTLNKVFKDTILEDLAQRYYFQNSGIRQKRNRFEKIIIERPRINCKNYRFKSLNLDRNIVIPSNKSNCERNCARNAIFQNCNDNETMKASIAMPEYDDSRSPINCDFDEEVKLTDNVISKVSSKKSKILQSKILMNISNSNNNRKQSVKRKPIKKTNIKSSLSTLQNIRFNEGKPSNKAKNIYSTPITPQLRELVKSLKISKHIQIPFDNVHFLKDIQYTNRMMEIATMNNDYLKNLKKHYLIHQKTKFRKHKKSRKRKPAEFKTKVPKTIQKNSVKPNSEWNAIVIVE